MIKLSPRVSNSGTEIEGLQSWKNDVFEIDDLKLVAVEVESGQLRQVA